jgi:hypothetical protein
LRWAIDSVMSLGVWFDTGLNTSLGVEGEPDERTMGLEFDRLIEDMQVKLRTVSSVSGMILDF